MSTLHATALMLALKHPFRIGATPEPDPRDNPDPHHPLAFLLSSHPPCTGGSRSSHTTAAWSPAAVLPDPAETRPWASWAAPPSRSTAGMAVQGLCGFKSRAR